MIGGWCGWVGSPEEPCTGGRWVPAVTGPAALNVENRGVKARSKDSGETASSNTLPNVKDFIPSLQWLIGRTSHVARPDSNCAG